MMTMQGLPAMVMIYVIVAMATIQPATNAVTYTIMELLSKMGICTAQIAVKLTVCSSATIAMSITRIDKAVNTK